MAYSKISKNLGFKGQLPKFIQSFLKKCTMQCRVGSTLSDHFNQEQGVPQGSLLSTTLFYIKISNIILITKQTGHSMSMIFIYVIAQKYANN